MATRYARAYMRVGRWVLPSFYFCQVGLPNYWRTIFLVLPKLDGCQVDLPNCWSCSAKQSTCQNLSNCWSCSAKQSTCQKFLQCSSRCWHIWSAHAVYIFLATHKYCIALCWFNLYVVCASVQCNSRCWLIPSAQGGNERFCPLKPASRKLHGDFFDRLIAEQPLMTDDFGWAAIDWRTRKS
jgi:hypothetical protein